MTAQTNDRQGWFFVKSVVLLALKYALHRNY